LVSGAIAGGEGSGSLSYDFEGTLDVRVGVGTAPAEAISGNFAGIEAGVGLFVVAIRYQAAPPAAGDIEVRKYECVDDELAGTVAFDVVEPPEGCGPGNGYLIGLEMGDGTVIGEGQPTVDGFVAFTGLTAGTYVLTEGEASSAPIDFAGGETIEVAVVNYVGSEPADGVLGLDNLTCAGDPPGTSFFIAPPGETPVQPAATLECVFAPESFLIYAFEDPQSEPIPFAIDASGEGSITLPAGTHSIVEPDSGAQATFTIASGATTLGLVQTVEAPAPTTGSVVVGAFACIGAQAGVEIEVGDPTFAADQTDLTDCVPLNELSFSIFPFGDTNAAPITGTTNDDGNGDGTVLLEGIPSTEGEVPAHLFQTVVFDSTFPATFEVAAGALTEITVIVFEPAPPTEPTTATATGTTTAPATTTSTQPATATSTATAAATGTVATLPSTGSGDGFDATGNAAWLLTGALALVALGSAGYAIRRRAA
jgi:hypothetical protein